MRSGVKSGVDSESVGLRQRSELERCDTRARSRSGTTMSTITKKELIDRIAEQTRQKRVHVKRIVQQFLDEIISELGRGNRLEFRDFGVFETRVRKARRAQNPKTLEPVAVPPKRTVKFKVGRLMKGKLTQMALDAMAREQAAQQASPSSTQH